MQFYDLIEATDDFDEIIAIIRHFEGDMFDQYLHQPECIVFRFGEMSMQEAEILADVMKERFGPIALCCEASLTYNQPLTLLNVLDTEDDWVIEPEFKHIVINAFERAGFMRSQDCESTQMRRLFCQQANYAARVDEVFMYDYETMKQNRQWLYLELTEYLHQPRYIQTWLSAGHSLEDYLL